MAVFDATALIHLLEPDAPAVTDPATQKAFADAKARIDHLVQTLEQKRGRIIVPAPALSEVLVHANDAMASYLQRRPHQTRGSVALPKLIRMNQRPFFNGLGPVVDIAKRAQEEMGRRAATKFSIFDYLHERETDLSRIFAGLLNPSDTHGRGDRFLSLFLKETFGKTKTKANNMTWNAEYTNEFDEWWDELSESEQDDITATVELLQEHGPQLPYPYSSGIKGSSHGHMRELRVQSSGRPIRVFYAFDPRRVAILLIGDDKTGNDRFYEQYVPVADKLYDEHLATLRKEGLTP